MKCKACGREGDREFCPYHEEAKARLEAAFPLWVKAHGTMDWKDYLDNVKRNVQTGQWAKETARILEEL